MRHPLDEPVPVLLRPIEVALALSHARRMQSSQVDPLADNRIEIQAWKAIEQALLQALTPPR
jgi:hypothetical protein